MVRDSFQNRNIQVYEEKSVPGSEKIEWTGYEISGAGIQPAKEKVHTINNLGVPKSVKQIRQVMGIINYYGRFIPNLAELASPMHHLLRKNVAFKWSSKEQKAFDQIKAEVMQRKTLAPFQTSSGRKVVLHFDASEIGIIALLEQEQANDEVKPILFWSSQFRKYEANYSVGRKKR